MSAMLSPGDFWVASGHHLCEAAPHGRLRATADLWRAFLARPELVPPDEACAAEVALHAALLAEPEQPVDAARIATGRAGERARGSVAASDAFFPFRDTLDELARAGVTAVIQPGGSVRDEESVRAANEHGIAMVLTGTRHFRH